MKNTLKPGSIALGFGLMLTTLGQAQQGAPSGTPLSFKVPPNALSAISFSTAPNVQCSVARLRQEAQCDETKQGGSHHSTDEYGFR